MKWYWFAILLIAISSSVSAGDSEQRGVAQRFVEAIKGERDFVRSDFHVFPNDASRKYLMRFKECEIEKITRPMSYRGGSSDNYAEILDKLTIGLQCRGVPTKTPVGLTLHFETDRIAMVETHNADLMKQSDG